jgi:5-methylcytosine-specific restriction endonuclease McrA
MPPKRLIPLTSEEIAARKARKLVTQALWVKNNPEKRRATKRRHYETHLPEIKAYDALRYEQNREESLAHSAAYHADHAEEIQARKRDYYWDNKENENARNKEYREENKERLNQQASDRYHADIEASREYQRIWNENNPEKRRIVETRYNRAHPEKVLQKNGRQRARRKNAPINDFTAAEWQELKEQYNYRCVYCGEQFERLTQDHIIPLNKGGAHTKSNIVPACRRCNGRKGDGPPLPRKL